MRQRAGNEPTITSFWPVSVILVRPLCVKRDNAADFYPAYHYCGRASDDSYHYRYRARTPSSPNTSRALVFRPRRLWRRNESPRGAEGRQRKRINAMQAPTGFETIREHVRVVSPLCQFCNLLALMLGKLEVTDNDRLDLCSYYRCKIDILQCCT